MPLNFPLNPSLNQKYSFGGKTWIWNGQGWALDAVGAINNVPIGNVTPNTGAFTSLVSTGNISAAGNITGTYFLGNGRNLTGVISSYGDSNVTALLTSYEGNIQGNNLHALNQITTGNTDANTEYSRFRTISSNVAYGFTSTDQPFTVITNEEASWNQAIVLGDTALGNANTVFGVSVNNNITVHPSTGNEAGWIKLLNLDGNGTISAYGNIVGTGVFVTGGIQSGAAISATGNVTGNYFIGNGSQLSGLPEAYSNSKVSVYLASGTNSANIITTGNVTGNYILGNGSQLTGLPSTYSNADVANYLASGTNSANIITTGNVTGNFFIGDGSLLTGIGSDYGNTEVAAFLPTYTGNLVSMTGNITTTANVNGGNLVTTGQVTAAGNVVGNYFIGNGSQLTGIASSYGNSDVESYLPTYTGNLVSLTGVVTTTANVTGGNLITTGQVSATANVTGGNLITTGLVSAQTLTATGNAIIGGDLTINGNLVYVNVADLNIEDPIISLGRGANDAPLTSDDGKDRGERLWYYDTAEHAAFVGYQNSSGKLIAAGNVSIAEEIVTVNDYGTFVVGTLESANVSATGNVTGGNLVTVGNVTAGNVTAALFVGSGASLTNIPGGNIVGTVSTANTVTDAAQPNITSVGTLSSLTVSGNIDTPTLIVNRIGSDDSSFVIVDDGLEVNGQLFVDSIVTTGNLSIFGNLTGVNTLSTDALDASGNVLSSNLYTGYISATGNVDGLNINTGDVYADVVSATGNVIGGNLITAGVISASGNITSAQQIQGASVSVTGNVDSGNVNASNVTATYTSITGNVDAGNVNTATVIATGAISADSLTATGNITGGNLSVSGYANASDLFATATISTYGNVNAGTAITTQGVIAALGDITGGNLISTGLVSAVGAITSGANITGGNIISDAAISAAGNITAIGNVIAANFIGNVISNITVPGANTQVMFNEDNVLSASSGLVFDYVGNALTVGGDVSTQNGGNLNVAGRVNVTGNVDVAVGNINGSNILGSYISASGNIIGGNITTGGVVTSSGNIIGGNITTGGVVTSSGNIIGGNISTAGLITATGDITSTANIVGAYIIGNGSALTSITGANVAGLVPNAANAAAVVVNSTGNNTNYIPLMTTSTVGNLQAWVENAGGFTYNPSTNLLTVGNITVSTALTVTGNIAGGNISTAGLITAVGNITSIANIAAGNLLTDGLISAAGNITGGNLLSSTLSLSGNVLSALNMTTDITTTGNITANNMAATTSINIAGTPVATVDDATALAIALG